MPELHEFDLSRYTESTRRELYDACVRLIWTPASPEEHVPSFTPDQAGLAVVFIFGRWFSFWVDLEEPEDAPTALRIQVVRILASPDSPFGIVFSEI